MNRALGNDGTKVQVIVIDDMFMVRRIIAGWLEAAGFRVLEAANAAQAREWSNEGYRVDLIVSELAMIRDESPWLHALCSVDPPVPIVAYTERVTCETVARVKEIGIQRFFTKPLQKQPFIETVLSLVKAQ